MSSRVALLSHPKSFVELVESICPVFTKCGIAQVKPIFETE